MTIATEIRRPIGTMIVYGGPGRALDAELEIARKLGAEVLEILPDWAIEPDPLALRVRVVDRGFKIHSAHGCWGIRRIRARRVDLGNLDPEVRSESVDDLRRCVDWLGAAGGSCLVVHPGGLSDPEDAAARRDSLARGLIELADHAVGTGVTLCVENMPPGVFPGTRMAELFDLVEEINRPEVALTLDTGHAQIASSPASETRAAGHRLATTHVHDNDGRRDVHLPPGLGSIDWGSWIQSLDLIGYKGPIVLECIRHLREFPESLDEALLSLLRRLSGVDR